MVYCKQLEGNNLVVTSKAQLRRFCSLWTVSFVHNILCSYHFGFDPAAICVQSGSYQEEKAFSAPEVAHSRPYLHFYGREYAFLYFDTHQQDNQQ
jgi:hypothetical protein